MPKITGVKPFKKLPNWDVINWTRKVSNSDFAVRVPEATKANMEQVADLIMRDGRTRNEFISTMVNKIGLSRAASTTFSNPLKRYKREEMSYGDTFEETFIGLVQAHVYDSDRDSMERVLFGRETPETQTAFHRITREEYYTITIDSRMIKRAFTSDYGISDMIDKIMQSPATSDEWDEFLQMSRLFREFYDRDGYFIRNTPNVLADTTGAAAKALIKQIRADAQTLRFVSRHYNAAGMPVAAQPEDMTLFVTPEVNAAIDVDALAAAFNIDRTDLPSRIEVIPAEQVNIPGFQAILTTDSWFVVMDTLYETTQQDNAAALITKYFLHHHEIISVSPFAPAILYSYTDAPTEIGSEDTPVQSVSVPAVHPTDENGHPLDETTTSVTRGLFYHVTAAAITVPEGGKNDAVILSVSGADSDFTRITNTGTLFVGPDESAASLTITATAVDDSEQSASTTVTVTGERVALFPDQGGDTPAPPEEGGDEEDA